MTAELGREEVLALVTSLYNRQYHSVPILRVEGAKVITFYFPEVVKDDITEEELAVKSVEHIEDPEYEGEGKQYSESHITLSKAPINKTVLSVYMEDNYLTQNEFDLDELKYIMGVLKQ
jgi:hypothetical protein